MKYFVLTLACMFLFQAAALAQFDWFKNLFPAVTETKLSDTKIADGLKEALKVGIDNAIKQTSQEGGFLDNEVIKIALPQKLQPIENVVRMIGFDKQLDDFILSMNRAAEAAAPLGRDIFLDALFEMNFDDAKRILEGNDTEATDYFKEKTYASLKSAFEPMVQEKLDEFELTQKLGELMDSYSAIPFTKNLPDLSINSYVIEGALEGLFKVLGEEEQKIRTSPQARVTELLEEVFK